MAVSKSVDGAKDAKDVAGSEKIWGNFFFLWFKTKLKHIKAHLGGGN